MLGLLVTLLVLVLGAVVDEVVDELDGVLGVLFALVGGLWPLACLGLLMGTLLPCMEGRTFVSSPALSSSGMPGSWVSLSGDAGDSGSALRSGSAPSGTTFGSSAASGSVAAVSGAVSGLRPSSGFFTPNISLSLSKLFCIFWSSPK